MDETRLNPSNEQGFGHIVEEILASIGRGEHPDIDHYAREYPEIGEMLRTMIPALRAVAESSNPYTHAANTSSSGNKVLGDFRLIRELGSGGMGYVYEAEQQSMGRHVAIKILPLAGALHPKSLLRFRNEVRAAASLDHPHIVSVYAAGEERGVHYYAMQLVRGQSLAHVISQLAKLRNQKRKLAGDSITQVLSASDAATSKSTEYFDPMTVESASENSDEQVALIADSAISPLSTREGGETSREYFRSVVRIILQAAEALQYAHSQGVIHRDIKPGNLLLDGNAHLYIADFGLARIETDEGMTMTGDIVGTLRYMSPEQALAKRIAVDQRSDVYSLGMTLYEFLTLRPAFPDNNRQELLRKIAFEDPPTLRSVNRLIPLELETIVRKAIEKSPDERYQCADDVAADLLAFLENRPIQAKPPSFVQRTTKWCIRHPAVLWSSTLTLLAVSIISVVSAVLILREQMKTTEALGDVRLAQSEEKAARELADSRTELALAEADRADGNLRLAMSAVDRLYTEIAENDLRLAPQAQAMRKRMLEQAVAFYIDFAKRNADSRLEFETAMAWRRVGEVRHRFEENLAAQDALLSAIRILRSLLSRSPHEPKYRSELASTYWFLSKPLEVMREFERGESYCRMAIDIQRKLVEEFPEDNAHLESLAVSLHQMGHLVQETDQAIGFYTQSCNLYETILEEDPGNPIYVRQLAHDYDHLGRLYGDLGEPEEAEERFRAATELIETAKDRTNADVIDSYHMILAALHRNWGTLQLQTKRFDQALKSQKASVELVTLLVEDFPDVVYYRYQLALSRIELGKSLAAMSRTNEAKEQYEAAQQRFVALVNEHPNNPSYQQGSQTARDLLQALPLP